MTVWEKKKRIKDIEDGVKIPSLAAVWLHLGLQLT